VLPLLRLFVETSRRSTRSSPTTIGTHGTVISSGRPGPAAASLPVRWERQRCQGRRNAVRRRRRRKSLRARSDASVSVMDPEDARSAPEYVSRRQRTRHVAADSSSTSDRRDAPRSMDRPTSAFGTFRKNLTEIKIAKYEAT